MSHCCIIHHRPGAPTGQLSGMRRSLSCLLSDSGTSLLGCFPLLSATMSWLEPATSVRRRMGPLDFGLGFSLCSLGRFYSNGKCLLNKMKPAQSDFIKCQKHRATNTYHTHTYMHHTQTQDFPDGSVVKNLAADVGDSGLIPGSGKSPGEGNGHPLQYSCLENPMDRGAWWALVHGVTKSQTLIIN